MNDCLMTMKLPLHHGKKFAIIISVDAAINTDETNDKFYENLENVISAVTATDMLIILGNFNTRVGQDSASREGVLGTHGTGKCNCNGVLLLQTWAKHNLLITNTCYSQHLGFILALSTGIWSTMSMWDGEIVGTWESWGPCVVQNAGQTIV